jgi:putative holliday junction resolvase
MNCSKRLSVLTWISQKKKVYNGVKQTVRILGLDPGEKRIGVAVTDPLGITAQGLEVISYSSIEQALIRIEEICRQFDVNKIVVGNPLSMSGTSGPAASKAEEFARRLHLKTGLPVVMVDERLTSSSVEKTLIAGGARRKKRREVRDKLAAVLILELYLAMYENNNGQ